MHRVIVFAAVSAVAMLPLCGQELIYAPGKTMGLENVPPPERNRWKARMISPAGFRDAPLVECREADFFTLEYGSPLKPFALKLDEKGGREFAQMAHSFNTMTEDINRYIDDIDALNRDKHTTEAELNIAREIQMGLLLPGHLHSDRYAINAYVKPAKDVGGDYYDYSVLDDGRIFVAVADVSGKGISASLFMARAITLLHQNAIGGHLPSEILETYNNTLTQRNPGGLFITTFVVIYDPSTGILTYSNAGHNIPYLLSDTLIPLDKAHGVAAGLFEGETYEDATVMIKPGDSLFLYTDGVNEAKSAENVFYSTERLEEKLRDCIAARTDNTLDVILDEEEPTNDTAPTIPVHKNIRGKEYYS